MEFHGAMVTEKLAKTETPCLPGLDARVLLLAYMMCADQEIHSHELDCLELFIGQPGCSPTTETAIQHILGDCPEKPPLELLMKTVPPAERMETLKTLATLAAADGNLDPNERALLETVANNWRMAPRIVDDLLQKAMAETQAKPVHQNTHEALGAGARVVETLEGFLPGFARMWQRKAPPILGNWVGSIIQEWLLKGPEYESAVRRCAAIAKEDIEQTRNAVGKARVAIQELEDDLKKRLANLQKEVGRSPRPAAKDVLEQLTAQQKTLQARTAESLEKLLDGLKRKERVVDFFTISFIGKTKAGKSSLHSFITKKGREAIGVGRQRTTRFNRVYEWKNIRFIDTPGIGAPGGKTDEEIAASVVDESDLICFVLTNDSQQQTEFRFLSMLERRGKPLLVLLNVQQNLRHPVRLKRFLANPDALFASDEQNLGGHLERINRYVREHYGGKSFEICPVHLLAALMSDEEEHASSRAVLLKASRMADFLNKIRLSLLQGGEVRRSQTLLGCPAADVLAFSAWLSAEEGKARKMAETIGQARTGVLRDLKTAAANAKAFMKARFGGVFNDLRHVVPDFAENHWDDSESSINSAWKRLAKERKIAERIQNAMEEAAEQFRKETKDRLEEVGRDLELIAQLELEHQGLSGQDTDAFWHDACKWGGRLLAAAGVIGLILSGGTLPFVATIIGGLVSWLSSWFESKEEKRRKAVAKIMEQLGDTIDDQEKEVTENATEKFGESLENLIKSVQEYFELLEKGLSGQGKALSGVAREVRDAGLALEHAFAKRLVDWLEGSSGGVATEEVRKRIARTARALGKSFTIHVNGAVPDRGRLREIESLLGEQITIETI